MADIHSTYEWKQLSTRLRLELPPVCWLCGGSIDRTLKPTHKLSWTLDHVKSAVDYPELALDPSNCRPAHRKCNSAKAAGRVMPQQNSRQW